MMGHRKRAESLYEYCIRLMESDCDDDKLWGKQLLNEWDYTRNENMGIDIKAISKGSKTEAFWRCEEGHEFKKSIVSRTGKDNKHRDRCRVCAYKIRGMKTRERALKRHTLRRWCNESSFGELILKEFDLDKNRDELGITPDNIPPFSETELNWICSKGHSYKAYLNNRTSNKSGCPVCKGNGTSYFEQLLYFTLKELYTDTKSRNKIEYKGKKLEFDIIVPEIGIYIEYGTSYTHPESIESRIKREYCTINNLDLVYIHSDPNLKEEKWSKEQILFYQRHYKCELDALNVDTSG